MVATITPDINPTIGSERAPGSRPPLTGHTQAVAARLRELLAAGALELPEHGGGSTAHRWAALAQLCGEDVALGRLAEGHVDAAGILAEAHRQAPPAALLGVWAAEGPDSHIEVVDGEDGGLQLTGRRRFCSGASSLSHALLAARRGESRLLLLVDLDLPGVRVVPGSWQAVGMAASDSPEVAFDSVTVGPDAVVGAPGFYVERPGFRLGSMGVAACWCGSARGLLDAAAAWLAEGRPDQHRLAHLGCAAGVVEALEAAVEQAALRVDRGIDPTSAARLARSLRAAVAGGVRAALGELADALGSGPLCRDAGLARRSADLAVYVSQFRDGAELAELGADVVAEARR